MEAVTSPESESRTCTSIPGGPGSIVDPKRDPSRKPPTLTVDPCGIPEELKGLSQWVRWRWVWRPTRESWTKVPIYASLDAYAATDNPATWGPYEDAFANLREHQVDGLGFVFTTNDPYCGIDIDGCRSPVTGEIDDRATRIIQMLKGWAEISPSGRGVHIIVKAVLPSAGRKNGGLEIYDRGRYFAVTGQEVGGSRAN